MHADADLPGDPQWDTNGALSIPLSEVFGILSLSGGGYLGMYNTAHVGEA
jgi:hypothetical protein